MHLVDYLQRQHTWSQATFGPGPRVVQVLNHLKKELQEVEEHPDDLSEWIDVIQLALDGALRQGYSPGKICRALEAKLYLNMHHRVWPDWRKADTTQAIEHIREGGAA